MNSSHPIKPPSLAIIKKWIIHNGLTVSISEASAIASLASRLGANQELEACCEWLDEYLLAPKAAELRAARRPKQSSLKEQALEAMNRCDNEIWCEEMEADLAIIRSALEQLDD